MDQLVWTLQNSPLLQGLVLGVFGACIGSFINVFTLRYPPLLFSQWRSQCSELLELEPSSDSDGDQDLPTLSRPRSRCPHCQHTLRAIDNVPILSFLWLRGRCAFCQQRISARYPIVEVLTLALTVQLGHTLGMNWQLLGAGLFLYVLLILSIIDFDHQLLPDNLVLPLLWAGLLVNYFELFSDLESAVIGAAAGYLVLWTVYQAHHRLTGKRGMGYGDFKLLAAIGAWLGWQALPLVILVASVTGTVVALFFIVFRHQGKDVPISFGPYLAVGAWVSLNWGDVIVSHYLRLFNL